MPEASLIGAVDIGGTKIAVAAVRFNGTIAARRSCPTAAERGPETALHSIVSMLRECALEAGGSFAGAGIGCTGPVDPETGIIGNVDLLPGWSGFPLASRLAEELNVPLAMENDADAAALAEASLGYSQRLIYLTVGTGIGAGLVFDGQLYRGAGGSHPEVGHMTIDASGPLCYCGSTGCWEVLASGPAMEEWAKASACPEDRIALPISARTICELAKAGHPFAAKVVHREARYLGIGIANLITSFCPDRIALGGGVMESSDLFLPEIKRTVSRSCGLVPFERTVIARSGLGSETALLGAARVLQHRFPELWKA